MEFNPVSTNLFKDSTYFEKKMELANTFGTRKAKSKMNAMKSNWVDEANISTVKEMNLLLKTSVKHQLEEVKEDEEDVKLQMK